MTTAVTIPNVSIFVDGQRVYKSQTVRYTDSTLEVRHIAQPDIVLSEYTIAEVAKSGEAWDVVHPQFPEQRVRVVVQPGCACGGMRPYTVDPTYSGTLAYV